MYVQIMFPVAIPAQSMIAWSVTPAYVVLGHAHVYYHMQPVECAVCWLYTCSIIILYGSAAVLCEVKVMQYVVWRENQNGNKVHDIDGIAPLMDLPQ